MSTANHRRIIELDPYLLPHEADIEARYERFKAKKKELLSKSRSLSDFASGHEYFGFHKTQNGWIYREWAPAAQKMYLTGDFNGWNLYGCEMTRLENGVFEVAVEDGTLIEGQKVQAVVVNGDRTLRRVPTYATRVVQDPVTYLWCAEIEDINEGYNWTDDGFVPTDKPLIYECHIGMAQEHGSVGSYNEFRENILPRVKAGGYNTIQIMAIAEHPYYGSFGYQVTNFFAPSSRYGSGRDLKALIDAAHGMGISVLLDIVHSHAAKNTNEGLNEFDGTIYQFFHDGGRGNHSAWDTKLFNYGKNEVIHFLLSNLKYWMKNYHFDGFRFDGVTSMLYHDHGLGSAFVNYGMYFSGNTDNEAVVYLQLANELIHSINKRAITIAEDMSGMAGMCLTAPQGGIGFDYRLSMGVPDMWIKLLKEYRDEDWDVWHIWHELTTCRPGEKSIGYCESHDQALVGDKTIMFRLCDAEMYTHMSKSTPSIIIDRGIALHKMIRLITATLAASGYLNFMGNEFGHPEWIDFPREGNDWSYHYCRRQWSLVENKDLRYCELGDFDADMIALITENNIYKKAPISRWLHNGDKVIIYSRGKLTFAFNFHPQASFENYFIPTESTGKYKAVFTSDSGKYGGFDRASTEYIYKAAKQADGRCGFFCYLPSRCAIAFKKAT